MNDVLLNKLASLQKCLSRVQEESTPLDDFRNNITKQDAAILNIQRACGAAIDIANIIVKDKRLGLPRTASESFGLLANAGIISSDLAHDLKKMVGFRNVAVRDYQSLDVDIIISVIDEKLSDFDVFANAVKQLLKSDRSIS